MAQIFGEFIDNLPESPEYLVIGFSPSSVPLKQRWRNNSLSADFLADYITTFFPSSEENDESKARQLDIKGAVNYIANELLENAMKFNDENSGETIGIGIHLRSDRIVFTASNSVKPDCIEEFKAYLERLTNSEPQEMYIHQLEQNAADDNCTASRLGYLTTIVDYEAKLGWKFETVRGEESTVVMVTTMVQLAV
ncbi:MAG: ATP-binding protein [Cyanobacteriota bacterium]|nr:ATP-binding protein [Cyanobacteriota bacterium]